MKDHYEKMISEIIRNINWNRIRHFHQALDVKWQFKDQKGHIVERAPTITELKEELRSLTKFVMVEDEKTLETGSWLIKWKKNTTEDTNSVLEVFFILDEAYSIHEHEIKTNVSIDKLNEELEIAVKNEDYERAAKIRDLISSYTEK